MVGTTLSAMAAVPLEAPGHMPPPARTTVGWKALAEARLSMANVVVGLAKVRGAGQGVAWGPMWWRAGGIMVLGWG